MLWLAVVIVLAFAIGLRRRADGGAHLFLVLAMTIIVGAWYFALARSA